MLRARRRLWHGVGRGVWAAAGARGARGMKGEGAEGAQERAVYCCWKAEQSSSRERDRKGYAKEPRREGRLEREVSDGERNGVHRNVSGSRVSNEANERMHERQFSCKYR